MNNLNSILINFVLQALKAKIKNKAEFEIWKRKFSLENKVRMFPQATIIGVYKKFLKDRKIKANRNFERILKLKTTRTISGVTPLAIFTKPYLCPGDCVYCPTQKGMPKSYLDDEPAVMRAIASGFSVKKQIKSRLKTLEQIGHATDKIELIIMGGTFSVMPNNDRLDLMIECLEECNENISQKSKVKSQNYPVKFSLHSNHGAGSLKLKVLRKLQRENEGAKHRIIGVTFETRPDFIDEKEVKFLRTLGGTRVELGVQSIYNDVLTKVRRGHGVEATIKATKLLKDAGFKIGYHLMPGLPGSSLKADLAMFSEVFTNPAYCPDMVKIYPCVVTSQAELNQWYQQGKFKPYNDAELIDLLIKIKQILPEWVRVNRLGRDIPVVNITAGTRLSNIRQVVQKEMKRKSLKCRCIRCREIRLLKFKITNLKLKIINYFASGGKEYFLQFVDQENRIYALLRLRIPGKEVILPVLEGAAIIRELHTFGPELVVKKKADTEVQHRGLGKELIRKAEEITGKEGLKKIAVISGVGVRDYYRKLRYQLSENYMVKYLNS